MGFDYLGNEVSSDQAAILAGVDDFVGGFLAYETRIERVVPAALAHPDATLLNAYAGLAYMFLESNEGPVLARKHLAEAERTQSGATERERLNVALLRAWVEDDLPQALRIAEGISDRWPRDLAVVKLHQYWEFNRGNSPEMLRVALKVEAVNREVPHFHGMAAFAYEQCHLLAEAEQAARTAVSLQRKEPWAQHALAHVLLTQGRIDEGIRFLESVRDTWVDLNSFMHTHIWWHLAVFYLARGRFAEALQIYDTQVWGIVKTYSQDQIGAVQLLTRLEFSGVDVGDRWEDLADHIAARGADTVQPFLSLLYLLGLARAKRPEALGLLEAIRERAKDAPAFVRATWTDVALPAAEGIYAWAQGDDETAIAQLTIAVPRLLVIGGSHAQRDLFDQVLLAAIARSGRVLAVQQALEVRRVGDPGNVPLNRALADLYRRIGLPQLAEQAQARAEATLAVAP